MGRQRVETQRTRQRIRYTAEIFTPSSLVVRITRTIPESEFGPGKRVFDPACGDGQFLDAAKWVKVLIHGMTPDDALSDIYGIDILRDNVDRTLDRLGGGVVVMADALNPGRRLEGQRPDEWSVAQELLASSGGAKGAELQLF